MPSIRAHVTLALCTILHAFTHAYGTMLVPLYLLMSADLKLNGVARATMLVTIYGVVYALCSYAAGVLADRRDRKFLLGVGLIGNAAAVALMGFTKQYETLVALSVLAGVCGALFHPAANALVPAHYPRQPGMAIGVMGIGSGIGFWAGPQFAGWRAQGTTWQLGSVADWQRPCVELGALGVVMGVVFLIVAREARGRERGGRERGSKIEDRGSKEAVMVRFQVARAPRPCFDSENTGEAPVPRLGTSKCTSTKEAAAFRHDGRTIVAEAGPTTGDAASSARSSILDPPSSPSASPLGRALRWRCVGIASVLSLREFAGIATITLASVYLQRALGRTPKETGFILGTMMLVGVVVNPVLVYATRGRRRIVSLVAILVTGGAVVTLVPFTPPAFVLLTLMLFNAFQLGSSAVTDAAMLERVSPHFRGRFVGLFLTIAGTVGALGPWVMGAWTDTFRAHASDRAAYHLPFLVAGLCMALAAVSAPLIASLGEPVDADPVEPITEPTPVTAGVVG